MSFHLGCGCVSAVAGLAAAASTPLSSLLLEAGKSARAGEGDDEDDDMLCVRCDVRNTMQQAAWAEDEYHWRCRRRSGGDDGCRWRRGGDGLDRAKTLSQPPSAGEVSGDTLMQLSVGQPISNHLKPSQPQ